MAKYLRLLLFEDCERNCAGCCNKQFDLAALPLCTDYKPYSLIMLTGGEPMLKPDVVWDAIAAVRKTSNAKIVLYTAKTDDRKALSWILDAVDGLTVTLHEQVDAKPLYEFTEYYWHTRHTFTRNKSLRLNVFSEVEHVPSLYGRWSIKSNLQWIDPCPLPEGEVFMRYPND